MLVSKYLMSSWSNPFNRLIMIGIVASLLVVTFIPIPASAFTFGLDAGGFEITLGEGEIESEVNRQLAPISNVFGGATERSLAETVANVIRAILGLVGVIFISLMIYAGFMWMGSAGNEERVKKAKGIIIASIIGVAIIIFAFVITNFVIDALIESALDT